MAGAGGTQVGQISVRVVPDLAGFYTEVKAAIEKYDNSEIKINVLADVTKFIQQVEDAKRGLDNSTVGVGGDTDEFERDVESATDDMDATVKVGANTKKAEKQLDRFQRRYLAKIETLLSNIDVASKLTPAGEFNRQAFDDQAKKFRVKVKSLDLSDDLADIADLRFEIDEFYREIELKAKKADLIPKNKIRDAKRDIERINERNKLIVDLDMDNLLFQWQYVEAWAAEKRLEFTLSPKFDYKDIWANPKLLRETLKGNIDVDFSGGGSALDKNLNRFTKGLSNVTQAAGVATGVVGSLFKLAGTGAAMAATAFSRFGPQVMAIAAAIAVLLPPVLALGAGLITLAPAALAALVPFGAIALGLDGIKKAAETAKPAFEELKKSVSSVFENGLPGQNGMVAGFKAINDRLLPEITASLQGVAQSITNSFNAVVGVLASPKGLSNLNNIFDNVAKGLDNAKAGLKDFTSGLLELISAISNKFPGLGTWFSELGEKFAGWVEKFTTLKDGEGLTGLERTIQNIRTGIEGLTGVFQAFFSQGLKDISSADFGKNLTSFFDSIKSFVQNTLPTLTAGFKEFTSLLKQLEPAFDLIGGLGNAFGLLTNPGKTVSDAISRYKETGSIKDFFTGIGPSAEKAGQEAGTGLNAGLQTGLEQTKKDIETAIKGPETIQVGGGIGKDGVGAAITGKVNTAISAAKSTLTAFQGEFAGMIAQAIEPINQIPEKLHPAFAGMGAAFVGAFTAIKEIVATQSSQVADTIAQQFMAIPTKLMPAIAGLGAAVGGALGAIKGFIANAGIADAFGQAFAGVAGRVASTLSGVPAAVSAAMLPAINVVSQVMLGIVNVVSAVGAQVASVASATFAQFPPAVQGAMSPAIATVGTIGQQMVSTALSFAGAMESAGRSIGASFAAGIASSASLVAGAASALMSAARVFIPSSPAEKGPFSGRGWVTYSGESVGEGFAKGMQNSTGEVVSTARELMQAVKDIFGSAEGLTLNFNMGPVTQQLGQVAAATQTFSDTLATTAKTATGFQDSISTVLPENSLSLEDSKAQKKLLDEKLLDLEIQRKTLELAKGQAGADQAAIKAQLEQIKNDKLQLGLQKDKLTQAEKYGEAAESTGGKLDQLYRDIGKQVVDLPSNFAKATGQQFMSDLGISGNGMIPQLLEQGSQFIFQVANMDTALSAQQTLQRRQGMGVVPR